MSYHAILYIIAASGLVIHILSKLIEYPGSLFSGWTKKDTIVTIISVIAIPVIMSILKEPYLADLLPLNKVTAFLVGYQTQSFLRSFVGIAGKKYFKHNEGEAKDA